MGANIGIQLHPQRIMFTLLYKPHELCLDLPVRTLQSSNMAGMSPMKMEVLTGKSLNGKMEDFPASHV